MSTEEAISSKQTPASSQLAMESDQEESSLAAESQEESTEILDHDKVPIDTCNGPTQSDAFPQLVEVTCDSCIENPQKASKSCLTCLVSYCDEHLRPHLENSKFQSHRLVEPQLDMEQRSCQIHHLGLELYCETDSCCICSSCETEEHQGHSITPTGEARKHIEVCGLSLYPL